MEIGRQVDSSGVRQYKCSRCRSFASVRYMSVFQHINLIHSFEPNFSITCGIDDCKATFQKMPTWRRHIRKEHQRAKTVAAEVPRLVQQDPPTFDDQAEIPDHCDDSLEQQIPSPSDIKRSAALFIMNTRDSGCVTQSFLDSLLENLSTLHGHMASNIQQRLVHDMNKAEQDPDTLKSVATAAVMDERNYDLFRDLDTEHRQNSYFRSEFNMIEPVERVLGRKATQSSSGFHMQNDCCYDIPLLQSLQAMLNCHVVKDNVVNTHRLGGRVLEDYCDGDQFAAHPVFSDHPTALQIILYYDDVEMANPLGSSATVHKLGLFYFSLCNLKPYLRSSTNSIQLVAVVKCGYIDEYGVDEILKPFVEDMKKLESEEGVEFAVGTELKRLRGGLVAFCGDNLASQLVGGFKALNSAVRRCRQCLGTKEGIQEKFLSRDFIPRTEELHKKHCALLGGDNHEHMARTYGVTRDSILNSLRYFYITTGLPPDVMHDVLEGCVQVEICCLLREFILVKKIFSLQTLNTRIANFPRGADAKDHPPRPLTDRFLGDPMAANLKLGASEAWSLARLLPVVIGDMIPKDDVNWENYLLLLDILGKVMAPKTTRGEATSLRSDIAIHHAVFRQLYPNRPLTPKMHYMVHIPEWTVRCGPIRHMWCMRYEAKHHYFKKMARVIGNFKNIAKTVACRHQRHMCYMLAHPASYLHNKLQMGRVESIVIERFQYKDQLLSVASLPGGSVLQRAKWVIYRGVKYETGKIVAVKSTDTDPVFGVILAIITFVDIDVMLVMETLETVGFDPHFHAYEVKPSSVRCVVVMPPTDLLDHNIVGSYQPFSDCRNLLYPKYQLLDSVDVESS